MFLPHKYMQALHLSTCASLALNRQDLHVARDDVIHFGACPFCCVFPIVEVMLRTWVVVFHQFPAKHHFFETNKKNTFIPDKTEMKKMMFFDKTEMKKMLLFDKTET